MPYLFLLFLCFLNYTVAAQESLPLREYPTPNSGDNLMILLSGDGGWHSGNVDFAKYYQRAGIPVVGWDARTYFKKEKDPATFTADLRSVIQTYCKKWNKSKVILVGYSFGAEVLPHAINQLPLREQQQVKAIILLVPGEYANYKVTYASMLNLVYSGDSVLSEIRSLNKDIPLLLVCEIDSPVGAALPVADYPRLSVANHDLQDELGKIASAVSNYFKW